MSRQAEMVLPLELRSQYYRALPKRRDAPLFSGKAVDPAGPPDFPEPRAELLHV